MIGYYFLNVDGPNRGHRDEDPKWKGHLNFYEMARVRHYFEKVKRTWEPTYIKPEIREEIKKGI